MSTPYDLTLHESLVVLSYIQPRLPYKLLAEWLGVYKYIIPNDRSLRESALYIPPRNNLHESCLNLWSLLQILENNCTDQEQSNIIRYIQCYLPKPQISKSQIQDSKISLTLPF